jgi:hypothetical protein
MTFSLSLPHGEGFYWGIGPRRGSDSTNNLLLNPIVSYHSAQGWSIDTSP